MQSELPLVIILSPTGVLFYLQWTALSMSEPKI